MKRRTFLKQVSLVASCPWLGHMAAAAPAAPAKAAAAPHNLLTCKIRVALPEDEAAGNGWKARRGRPGPTGRPGRPPGATPAWRTCSSPMTGFRGTRPT